MDLLVFILLLVGLIIVHEFGHFVVAKAFGIRVDEFGIFFPPRIFAFRKGETEYSLNWLPFGGFVRIFGENEHEGANDPRSFAKKSRLIQAAVLLAGIVFNILIAWLLLSAGYIAGMPSSVEHPGFGTVTGAQTQIVGVVAGSPADKAGLESGDIVTDVQTGTASLFPNSSADQVQAFIQNHQNESIVVEVERAGEQKEFLAKPIDGLVPGRKALGIQLDDVGVLKLSPPVALLQGGLVAGQMVAATGKGLGSFFWSILRGVANFSGVAGPIGIATIGSSAVSQGFAATVTIIALISINLALVNLLPVPGLDGGRLLFIIVEAITRRSIPERWAWVLTVAGFAALILLMLVISYHDVLNLIHSAA